MIETLAEHEERFTETLYAHFFARCPKAIPLFGEHSHSEKSEMVLETFRSLLAVVEGAPWLPGNLEAMGNSHREYGVEGWMFAPFEHAFAESVSEVLDEPIDTETIDVMKRALAIVTAGMNGAGVSRMEDSDDEAA